MTPDMTDPRPDLRVVVFTTPEGLYTLEHLLRHVRVVGVIVDQGGWPGGVRERIAPMRWLRRLARSVLDRLGIDRDPYYQPRRPRPTLAWADVSRRWGVEVARVRSVNAPESVAAARRWNPDLGVVIGGRILQPEVFTLPRLGTINKHSSLLPRHRGLAAEYWCLYHGDLDALGLTVHFVEAGADTGPIVLQVPMPLHRGDTPGTLRTRSDRLGREALVDAVRRIARGGAVGTPQDHARATHNPRPTPRTDRELRRRLPELWRQAA